MAVTSRSLYDLSSSVIVTSFYSFKSELKSIPEHISCDIYFKLYEEKKICVLGLELIDLNIFYKMLKVTHRKTQLLQCFQTLMDHGFNISMELSNAYASKCLHSQMCSALQQTIDLGLTLGEFLNDAGWQKDSEVVLIHCRDLCLSAPQTPTSLRKTLDCYHNLLNVQVASNLLPEATSTYQEIKKLIHTLRKMDELPNLAALYDEISSYFVTISEFNEALKWSAESLRELVPGLPASTTVNILRQLAHICFMRGQSKKAGVLIRQALRIANEVYEPSDHRLPDVIIDYGNILLNDDAVCFCPEDPTGAGNNHSVEVLSKALEMRKAIYGHKNIYVAFALEELANALYWNEKYVRARECIEESISIQEAILPPNHPLLASSLGVKGLILEGLAFEEDPSIPDNSLLLEAEKLHITTLELTIKARGINSEETAHCYHELGSFYHLIEKYKEAEALLLQADAVKEKIFGTEYGDRVSSLSTLACLYVDLDQYHKAEELYLRSIETSIKFYGETYSGLREDYEGLVHCYEQLGNTERMNHYITTLSHWEAVRRHLSVQNNCKDLEESGPIVPLPDLLNYCFKD
ncbi:amyloid protein-binding protein 2-like isoform X2 [Thrips palmi]|uniref:Amyloid protein-binding protein 2-like isoform X2 n=1 Tax=Thrips palmi TaxID=161013 RepID=A0A6P8YDX2_THRPL|nr:amyloid protein-binding protein 2-like isoform X2 [Thrips palmi]